MIMMVEVKKIYSSDLTENLPYQIAYTANFNKAFWRQFHKIYMDKQVTADEFSILGLLYSNPSITQTKIGKLLFRGKAHIGKILNEMELKKLIHRRVDEYDGAITNIVLPKGYEILSAGIDTLESIIASQMKAEFSEDEQALFMSYLKRYRQVLNSIVDVDIK